MKTLLGRLTVWVVLLAFVTSSIAPAYAQALPTGQAGLPAAQTVVFSLPSPGVRVGLSPEFIPTILKGIKIYPDNPFKFDFIVDTGDSNLQSQPLKEESNKLIKYFLASLTTPEDDLWVNLSPYEKDRIIPE